MTHQKTGCGRAEAVQEFFNSTHYRMVDVGHKQPTYRRAVAEGRITVGKEAFELIKARKLPKGDALMLAEIAGVMGAKRAQDLLPLCHPMGLDQVLILTELEPDRNSVLVFCLASTFAKTGVEMEALMGVNAALLAIYDLTKMVEAALSISDVRLLLKEGGKSGRWLHPDGIPKLLEEHLDDDQGLLDGYKAAVLTISDRASSGTYEDRSGGVLRSTLETLGAEVVNGAVVPDTPEAIRSCIQGWIADQAPDLIITTGGTGVAPRDITPETVSALCDREVPGLAELLRQDGAKYTKHAWLSRSFAGIAGKTLIISLPGNPKAVAEGMAALQAILPHALHLLRGEQHD